LALAFKPLIVMPSFQPWGPPTQASRLPPTPPEYQPLYQTPASMMSEQTYYPPPSDYQARHGQSGRDFIDRYSQGTAYASQHSTSTQNHSHLSQMHGSQDYRKVPPYVAQIPSHYQYGNMAAAPILPPIRARDGALDPVATQYRVQDARIQSQQKTKDDAPSGGVAAHLDYDMDLMANFVAEMAQGMYAKFTSGIYLADIDLMRSVSPGSRPTPQFHKYVLQILSSTRLPSSTIVLGLFYLASRMKIVSENGEDTRASGTVYRMLTTCLLLGSKFLDDNTFQNRSWADVSSIPVFELNKMELDWLKGFDWTLHGPMYHEKEGFYMWREHWKAYEEDAQLAKARESQKLAPLDTTVARVHQSTHQPMMSPEGPIPLQYQRSAQYDTRWVRPLISDYSPPSAPHSGPTTPDYYNHASWHQAPPPYSRQPWANSTTPVYSTHRSQPPSYPHTPSYIQGYSQSVWNNHGPSCTCSLCPKHSEHYFTHPTAYGIQSVAG
jgi:Cyclin